MRVNTTFRVFCFLRFAAYKALAGREISEKLSSAQRDSRLLAQNAFIIVFVLKGFTAIGEFFEVLEFLEK